ncbi:hypothetical protein GGQ91_001946 [Methylobacterium fujisawaense]|nr:hypothetical protein [Methylobacterium fujisawaense]
MRGLREVPQHGPRSLRPGGASTASSSTRSLAAAGHGPAQR